MNEKAMIKIKKLMMPNFNCSIFASRGDLRSVGAPIYSIYL